MMSPKERVLAALRGKPHDRIPNLFTDLACGGATALTFDAGPAFGGYDDFGVLWETSESAGGQACPITVHPVLEDISQWREKVHFPDVDAFDWEGAAQLQLGHIDREQKLVEFQMWSGPFERLTHLMGFENALCAMYEDPEETAALLGAITDYKISIIRKAKEYYTPDIITTLDDVATERGLFMSPDLYYSLIAPCHKRLNEETSALGMMSFIHCCGYCEDIVPGFADEGYLCWTVAQPTNHIRDLLKKVHGRLAIAGGYNTNGAPGLPTATEEEMRAEVRRCIDEYGSEPNYMFMGFRLSTSAGPEDMFRSVALMEDECASYGVLQS